MGERTDALQPYRHFARLAGVAFLLGAAYTIAVKVPGGELYGDWLHTVLHLITAMAALVVSRAHVPPLWPGAFTRGVLAVQVQFAGVLFSRVEPGTHGAGSLVGPPPRPAGQLPARGRRATDDDGDRVEGDRVPRGSNADPCRQRLPVRPPVSADAGDAACGWSCHEP